MSSFLLAVPRDGSVLNPGQFSSCVNGLRAGVLGDVRALQPSRTVVLHAPLVTGDSRIDESCVERLGLVVAGQVRLDDRDSVVRSLRGFGLDASDSDSDIALFAAAWQHYGAHAPEYLIGDFSAAVWEPITKRLSLVRDRFGVRLLYYASRSDMLVASNSLRAVVDCIEAKALNAAAIADYVSNGFNSDQSSTFYRDVRRVPPAHVVELAGGRTSDRTYWRLEDVPTHAVKGRDFPTYFRHALTHAVRDRWRGQNASILMSGGVDSTALASLAARELTQPQLLHAITVDLPTIAPSLDAARARLVAKRLGISHTVVDGDLYGFIEGVEGSTPWQTAEPYEDHDLPVWRALLQKAAAHSSTLFYGEDPDSLLAPPGIRSLLAQQSWGGVLFDVTRHLIVHRQRPHFGLRMRSAMKSPHPRAEAVQRLTSAQWQPLFESLDARNVGVALDARLPYLDLRVIAAAFSAPAIPWAQHKRLLREAMRGLLPDEVRMAPKQGLPTHTSSRIAQWRTRLPAPFAPSAKLREHVNDESLRRAAEARSPEDAMLQLRFRVLDRWLLLQ